jgi:hypothetical protein
MQILIGIIYMPAPAPGTHVAYLRGKTVPYATGTEAIESPLVADGIK